MNCLPCCNSLFTLAALKWNPHNEVFQCHSCGTVYDVTPRGPAKEPVEPPLTYYTHVEKGGRYYIVEQWREKLDCKDAWVDWVKYRSADGLLTFSTGLDRWLYRFRKVAT